MAQQLALLAPFRLSYTSYTGGTVVGNVDKNVDKNVEHLRSMIITTKTGNNQLPRLGCRLRFILFSSLLIAAFQWPIN